MYILKRFLWHLQNEKNFLHWARSRFLFYSGLGRLFIVECGLYRIRFFPSALSLTKWLDPSYGSKDESVLRTILRPGDTVIDVGANIGTLSLAAAALVGDSGKVIVIEPDVRIFKFLKKNVSLNRFKNVILHNCAVGENEGEVSFSDKRSDDQNKVVAQGKRRVPIKMLDEQVSSIQGRIRLLKVDVEGYEKFVFMGAVNTLSRTDFIYFEVYDSHFKSFGYTTSELLEMLRIHGFSFYRIDKWGEVVPISTNFVPEHCMNILGERTSTEAS